MYVCSRVDISNLSEAPVISRDIFVYIGFSHGGFRNDPIFTAFLDDLSPFKLNSFIIELPLD